MTAKNVLTEKSFRFAVRVVKFSQYLRKNHKEFDPASQVFRSGTATGALVKEAEFAESRKDFIHKMHIALKESNETEYWLELSAAAGVITNRMFESMFRDNQELKKILVASIKTAKRNLANN